MKSVEFVKPLKNFTLFYCKAYERKWGFCCFTEELFESPIDSLILRLEFFLTEQVLELDKSRENQ